MADRLSAILAGIARLWLPALCLGALSSALAQSELADPTRPATAVVAGLDSAAEASSAPVLQSVLLPQKGKPVAIISGQRVSLGEMFGERRLVRLNEREAVLEGPLGGERLPLTPGIEKKNVTARAPLRPRPAVNAQKGEKQ